MSFATLTALGLVLAISLIPMWLLRRRGRPRARDDLIAFDRTRPEVVRNASIAYALRTTALGPLFAWGASGELWLPTVAAASFGAGVYLFHVMRGRLVAFVDSAIAVDSSITVHAFVAEQHGSDPLLRRVAAALSLCALVGLLLGEAIVLAGLVAPLVGGSTVLAAALVSTTLASVVLCAVLSGHAGIMHSAQLQLGMLYLGLFGAAALVLYMHASARAPMPPHGALALVALVACGAIVLVYRRSKYVDTDPIRSGISGSDRPSRGARALSRFEKILNVVLSILLAVMIVVALLDINAAGWTMVASGGMAALRSPTRLPTVAPLALVVMPLFYPLVDVTNWLRVAALRTDADPAVDPGRRSAALKSALRIYAVETALIGVFVCALGAVAASAIAGEGRSDSLQTFFDQLLAADNSITALAVSLLSVFLFAAAVSTMSALYSASLATLRYDLLAPISAEPSAQPLGRDDRATARPRTLGPAVALGVAIVAAFVVAQATLRPGPVAGEFVALLVALACAQLALAPLVLGPIIAGTGPFKGVSPGWALIVLGSGAGSGVAAAALYIATGVEAWLWSASPICLASGWAIYAIARAAGRRRGEGTRIGPARPESGASRGRRPPPQ